jgi:hypothetical protein
LAIPGRVAGRGPEPQVSLLLLLTPEEVKTSFADLEFDHSVPSSL